MAALRQKIEEAYREALRARDRERVETLRYLRAQIKNEEIARGKLREEDLIALLRRELRRRKEAIQEYEASGRADLAARERREMELLEQFLPPELSDEELDALIREVVQEIGALGMRDFGRTMKEVMARLQGRAQGARVAERVRQLLGG